MPSTSPIRRALNDLLTAVQFLTRIPTPNLPYDPTSLARSTVFFPVIGLFIGSIAAFIHSILVNHLPRSFVALVTLGFMVVLTGALHEDGLADTADGFGGGSARERILEIFRDSRLGTYGVLALVLSFAARILLLASLPLASVTPYLIAAAVLCRWTTLPLSYALPSARNEATSTGSKGAGQGARIAHLTSRRSLILGSLMTLAIILPVLKIHSVAPLVATLILTMLTGLYYKRRIQGVTGDTFGATNQLTEIAVYLCGVWV